MSELKNRFQIFKYLHLHEVIMLVLGLLAALLLWFNSTNSNQAVDAMLAQVCFEGEYRVGDSKWQNITPGQHIPAAKGDVTLRGNFHLYAPDGEYVGIFERDMPIAFYTDHINLAFCEGEDSTYVIDHENQLYGVSACGVNWTAHSFSGDGTEPIEMIVHNSHRFGNENAIDEMLSNVAIWDNIDSERNILERGKIQRNAGLLFVAISFVLLGSALFSTLLHVQNNRMIWLLGGTILSAGIYLIYSAAGISFWSELIVSNTTVLGFSMMFYMLFVSCIITCFLEQTKKIGYIAAAASGIMNGIYFGLPMVTNVYFYDTWLLWAVTQSLVNIVLFVCLIKECMQAGKKKRWILFGLGLPLLAFEADVLATAAGIWKGGAVSKYVFFVLAAAALFTVLRIIPESINAAAKARELEIQRGKLEAEKNMVEAELKESRISIMLSQIQPHFIYNTLGTIERLCLKDPEKASALVRNFSLYLRGNFSELNSVIPIRFSEELKHIEYYVNIEKVRFPDMCIEYDVETTDFVLPALSVQPLVENAIKHGLMRLETGGTVVVRSYETSTHYCVEIKDDGVGFDTSLPVDEKKHVGLRNIRERLKTMVNGELILESEINCGTKALIMIPKEGIV